DAKIIRRAIGDSFVKLDPRTMMRNPVMFVVEVGSLLTTLGLVRGIVAPVHGVTDTLFELQITLWLWFTVLFANFAEAMAEGRGKAQADNLRKARTETTARRLLPNGKPEIVNAPQLRNDHVVLVVAGEVNPGDGEIIDGGACVGQAA